MLKLFALAAVAFLAFLFVAGLTTMLLGQPLFLLSSGVSILVVGLMLVIAGRRIHDEGWRHKG